MLHNPKCHARHIGPWLIETGYLNSALSAIKAGTMPTIDAAARGRELDSMPPYVVDENGVAFVSIDGPMMRGDSKFSGTNTVRVRSALRDAAKDPRVKSVLLMIDSPGGTVAGTEQLAADIAATNAKKRTVVHVDGMMASAALWAGTQASRIFANETAEVGSIGVVAIVEDSSAAAQISGVKVHVVSTGEYKGAFADGAPITESHLEYLQNRVDEQGALFVKAVLNGRKIDPEKLQSIADGRMFSAKTAKKYGLIDEIANLDAAYQFLVDKTAPRQKAAANAINAIAVRDRLRALG